MKEARRKRVMLPNIRVLYLLGIFGFLIFGLFVAPRFTSLVIDSQDKIIPPTVEEGEEIESLGYKYSNTNGILVSVEPYISCKWKSPEEDDGYKVCEAVFEVEDKSRIKRLLNNPEIFLDFENKDNIKNLKIKFSKRFSVGEEEYVEYNESEENVSKPILKQKENYKNFITGNILKNKERQMKQRERKEKRRADVVREKSRKSFKEEKKFVKKRKYRDFFEISNDLIVSKSTPSNETDNSLNESLGKNNSLNSVQSEGSNNFSIEDPSNETKINKSNSGESNNFSAIVNETSNFTKNRSNTSLKSSNFSDHITGFFSYFKNRGLDTSRPFAVKVSFEIPKYEKNSFNFEIIENKFQAKIDPSVSGCGTLDSANSVYSLTQDLSTSGTCLTINADNITLDCNGHSIDYSSSSSGYGIYSNSSNTDVQNCVINEKNSGLGYSYGIYFTSDGGTISGNTINKIGSPGAGIYFNSGSSNTISNNIINSSLDGRGIYLYLGSNNNIVSGNTIYTSGASDYGVYVLSSTGNIIRNNKINTTGNYGHGVELLSANSNIVDDNTIYTFGSDSYGGYIDGNYYNLYENNSVYVYGSDSHGIYLYYEESTNITGNTFLVNGSSGTGIYVEESLEIGVYNNTVDTYGDYGYGIDIYYSSDNAVVSGNIVDTYGDYGYGIMSESDNYYGNYLNNTIVTNSTSGIGLFLDSSYDSNFSDIFITTSGTRGYGVYMTSLSQRNKFTDIFVNTFGSEGNSLYLSYSSPTFSFYDSIFNSSDVGTEDFYINNLVSGGIWNFTNTSLTDINWTNSGGVMNVLWYVDLLAMYKNGTYVNASEVNISNGLEASVFSGLTNSSGRIIERSFREYYKNKSGSQTIYYSNYTLNLSKSNKSFSENFNLTGNKNYVFLFDSNSAINLISPLNDSNWTESKKVNFSYNFSNLDFNNCSLMIDNNVGETDGSVMQNQTLSFEKEIDSGEHSWRVDCLNLYGTFSSGNFSFNYDYEEGSSGGGGGGGGGECTPKWKCSKWSKCKKGKQKRECELLTPSCKKNKPEEKKKCKKKDKEKNLFDINLEIFEEKILSGENLSIKMSLLNIGVPGRVNASLYYEIKRDSGEVVYKEEEIIPVETQTEFIKEIDVSSFKDGEYSIFASLKYEGQTEPTEASRVFTIGKEKKSLITYYFLIGFLTISLIAYLFFKFFKKRKNKGEQDEPLEEKDTFPKNSFEQSPSQ